MKIYVPTQMIANCARIINNKYILIKEDLLGKNS